ncbi:hypothetical protein Q766_06770 [Flavobacterium subsaxonicum WB 4.1-42 = DSM 21790]|uniref:Uncharacterized protein n=1 Tax=Flavobacterium subsaxonicum WB 4.1-42 = DSM 21790 TaxID=1121898 RepID=A0A0A2MQG3_9FLAO|nr:hypothetical protein Q766_06770 [Flavobacterium subsaxonicum WB 4.1-42 = DSM 21790]
MKFTTSINIIRDKGKELNYIPTPNSIRVVNQIVNDFKKGLRSFNIIGSYGTGKSSFLWAFQESFANKKKYFGINFVADPSFEFIDLIGEFRSLREVFAETFQMPTTSTAEDIFLEIYQKYRSLGKTSPILFILIDEFGKFLEYAAQNEPEKELYFVQQLAEFINNPDHNIVLFTTVHQNFDAYAVSLSQAQRMEWGKVKGRFKEITFNEPVEQLLFLASEHLKTRPSTKKYSRDIVETINLLLKSKAFNINEDYVSEIAEKLFPLDSISAYVLTLSLQKYGQNERSLFTFLESTDHTGLFQHTQTKDGFYSIADVYDYLMFNYHSFLNSRYNPDFSSWKSIKSAIENVETSFEDNVNDSIKIIKTIGLLSINSLVGARLDRTFLAEYSKKCLSINNSMQLIEALEIKKIIIYRNYSMRFVLFEGSDLDIQNALIEAGEKVDDVTDIVTLLNKHFTLPPTIAKKITYETGTPRLFEYRISSYPISDIPKDDIDGFINLVFNEKETIESILEHSASNPEAILFCYYKNSKVIRELLFEIEKTKKVIAENGDDKVAIRELNNIVIHQQNLLSHKILNNFNGVKSEVEWIFDGKIIAIANKKNLNNTLSDICNIIYSKAPIFNNELVNKHKISSSIHTAKKSYFKALVNNWDKPQLGFQAGKYPPEKTIYLSLLENNDIYLYGDDSIVESIPNSKNRFDELWTLSKKFLESAKISKRKLSEFTVLLNQKPFKLKQGLIDFWVPTFLFIKRDDFALFGSNGYIPYLNDEVLELLVKNPENYEIKTFDIEGVKLDIFNSYRIFLNQNSKHKLTNGNFIETIKPFLTFYKNLPNYSKFTKRLTREGLEVRNVIASSKDPEQTFFEDFPLALGYSISKIQSSGDDLQNYSIKLQEAVRDIRTSYDELVNRFEDFILQEIIGESLSFENYKTNLQSRYKKLRRHLLLGHQKVFVQRLDSGIDDKRAWINSLVQALINTTLDNIKDEQEIIIYDKFKEMILELDSLTVLSKSDFKEDKEDVFDLQINSFSNGSSKKVVRLPKSKKNQIDSIQDNVRKQLSNDPTLNIAALTNLLNEIIRNE